MSDLTQFLHQQIARDAQRASSAIGQQNASRGAWRGLAKAQRIGGGWSAERVLAECDAKQRIVEAYESSDNRALYGGCGDDCEWKALEYAMRCLALPYADREGFREEWRV